ncbi:MAG: hypothetical protein M3301_08385, partial [Chloroflexota bacterium]|nr:hypothetical protein [Chloroflexota bacterium]
MIPRRWLIRLYPPGWRRRYGEEFLALLEELPLGAGEVWDVLRAGFSRRLRNGDDRGAAAHNTGGSQTMEAEGSHGQVNWDPGIASGPRPRRLALVGLVLVLPTLSFLFLALLKYGMGIGEPFDRAEAFFLNRIVETFTVAAPWV